MILTDTIKMLEGKAIIYSCVAFQVLLLWLGHRLPAATSQGQEGSHVAAILLYYLHSKHYCSEPALNNHGLEKKKFCCLDKASHPMLKPNVGLCYCMRPYAYVSKPNFGMISKSWSLQLWLILSLANLQMSVCNNVLFLCGPFVCWNIIWAGNSTLHFSLPNPILYWEDGELR